MDSTKVTETERYFAALAAGLQSETQKLAELVAGLDSKVGREFGAFREDMRKEFAELKAIIRSTFTDPNSAP